MTAKPNEPPAAKLARLVYTFDDVLTGNIRVLFNAKQLAAYREMIDTAHRVLTQDDRR